VVRRMSTTVPCSELTLFVGTDFTGILESGAPSALSDVEGTRERKVLFGGAGTSGCC